MRLENIYLKTSCMCIHVLIASFPVPHPVYMLSWNAWARALWEDKTGGGVADFPTFEELERTKGAIMTTVAEAAWDRWEAKVRAEGIEQGVERGVRRGGSRLLIRQAALKFGAATAERLAGLLKNMTEQEELDRVGDWILECGSGGEFLSRVSSLLGVTLTRLLSWATIAHTITVLEDHGYGRNNR